MVGLRHAIFACNSKDVAFDHDSLSAPRGSASIARFILLNILPHSRSIFSLPITVTLSFDPIEITDDSIARIRGNTAAVDRPTAKHFPASAMSSDAFGKHVS